MDLEETFGDAARELSFSASVSFISDEGLSYLIEENEAKIKELQSQCKMLRKEIERRKNNGIR